MQYIRNEMLSTYNNYYLYQLLSIDKAMILVLNIDLLSFIMMIQKEIAEKSKNDLDRAGVYKNPIVTEITPFPQKAQIAAARKMALWEMLVAIRKD